MAFVGITTYSIELPDINIRGAMAVMPNVFLASGCITCVSLGFVLRWYQIPFVGISLSLACFLAMVFIPESPTYLVTADRKVEAKQVLRSLRGPDADIDEKIWTLHAKNKDVKRISFLEVYRRPEIIKSTAIVLVLFFLQNFSGLIVVEVNAARIFISLGTSLDEKVVTVLLFTAELMGICLAVFFLDRIGRRNCMIFSLVVCAFCLLVFGTYTFLRDTQGNSYLEIQYMNSTAQMEEVDSITYSSETATGTSNSLDR